ncbi:MAG: response regulator [Nitrospirota bacterium]
MHKAKILIIDDEVIVLKAYARELESFGHAVYTASRGKEAIKIAQRERPDIVFTDMVMPEMDGVEVCRKIKEMYSDTEVILISGYPDEVIEKESGFFAAGGRKDWLRKPLEMDELPKAVEKVILEKQSKSRS